jgi:hypothetical protein
LGSRRNWATIPLFFSASRGIRENPLEFDDYGLN